MQFDPLGFKAQYDVMTEVGIPPAGEPLWFPPTGRRSSDGLVIRVVPEVGPVWTGAFRDGGGSMMKGVFGTPRADALLVVCGGSGYLVPAAEPRAFTLVWNMPIMEVHGVPEMGLLVLVSFVEVCGVGAEGMRWESGRFAYDGVEIQGISGGVATGVAWSSPRQDWEPFRLNLETGRYEGGAWE